MNEEDIHWVHYSDNDPELGRHYWECIDCGKGGSVTEFNSPEEAAERAHGDIPIGRTTQQE